MCAFLSKIKFIISSLDASNALMFPHLHHFVPQSFGRFMVLNSKCCLLTLYVIALLAWNWQFESFKSKILQEFMTFCIMASWDEEGSYGCLGICMLQRCSCVHITIFHLNCRFLEKYWYFCKHFTRVA